MLFYIQRNDDDITHHGIKGQKWGVRRFQNKDGTRTLAGKERLKEGANSGSDFDGGLGGVTSARLAYAALHPTATMYATVNRKIWGLKENPDNYLSTDSWSDKQKEWYNGKRTEERETAKKVKSEKDLKTKEPPDTAAQALKNTEPMKGKYGHTSNCMYCAATFELRRRGYDVHANSRKYGGNDGELKEWYKNPEQKVYKPASKALVALRDQPDGARGCLGGSGPFGGHELAYEVKNKSVSIYDPQSGKRWSEGKFMNYYEISTVTRLDNAQINWKAIGEILSDDSVIKKG